MLNRVGILLETDEFPTRSGYFVPRERAGEGRKTPLPTLTFRGTPRSICNPEALVLESQGPFGLFFPRALIAA